MLLPWLVAQGKNVTGNTRGDPTSGAALYVGKERVVKRAPNWKRRRAQVTVYRERIPVVIHWHEFPESTMHIHTATVYKNAVENEIGGAFVRMNFIDFEAFHKTEHNVERD